MLATLKTTASKGSNTKGGLLGLGGNKNVGRPSAPIKEEFEKSNFADIDSMQEQVSAEELLNGGASGGGGGGNGGGNGEGGGGEDGKKSTLRSMWSSLMGSSGKASKFKI
jgi:hypothetical protein